MPGSNVIEHQFTLDTSRPRNTRQFRQPPYLTEQLKETFPTSVRRRHRTTGVLLRTTLPSETCVFKLGIRNRNFFSKIDLRSGYHQLRPPPRQPKIHQFLLRNWKIGIHKTAPGVQNFWFCFHKRDDIFVR